MQSHMLRCSIIFVCLSLFFGPVICCQSTPGVGIPPNSSLLRIPLGFVDLRTGQVHLEIPIASIPQRGGIPLVAKVVYDTTFYTFPFGLPTNGNGWTTWIANSNDGGIGFDNLPGSEKCTDLFGTGYHGTLRLYKNFRVFDSNGTRHPFADPGGNYGTCYDPSNHPHLVCENCNTTWSSTDGEGFSLYISPTFGKTAWTKSGAVVSSSSGLEKSDTNGNTGGQFTQAPVTAAGSAQGCGYPSPGDLYVHTSDGTTQAYTFYCQTFTVGQFTESLLSSVVLPDGTQYSFTYDTSNQGVLNGVTLPTGGQIQFNYINASVPRLASVTTAGGTWNFSQGGQTGLSGAGTATIVSPLNDTTVITQDSTATRVASIQYYKGSATLLKTYTATYTTYPGQCRTTATITLNDTGQTAQTTYQNFFNGICSLPQQIQEWDYGAAAPTRTTKTTYIQDTSSNHYNTQYHIYDRPLSVAVYAGDGTNGSPIANTLYAYEYSAS